jgi:hypothetical protein
MYGKFKSVSISFNLIKQPLTNENKGFNRETKAYRNVKGIFKSSKIDDFKSRLQYNNCC